MRIKKFLKILSLLVVILIVLLYFLFGFFTAPKSNISIAKKFENTSLKPNITHQSYNGFQYRKLEIINDTIFPTIVFVHGTIGSCIDFIDYMKDTLLSKRANFISYDRVGYNYRDKSNVQESIAFERDMLQSITQNLSKQKTILVGYSYGGPIALADFTNYKSLILLAPAVYSKVEPMPWMINFYKWKLTRWMVPDIWKQAAKEKLSHQKDLRNFEMIWKENSNQITVIHGDNDGIVPYSNSKYLIEHFPKNQIELITIADA